MVPQGKHDARSSECRLFLIKGIYSSLPIGTEGEGRGGAFFAFSRLVRQDGRQMVPGGLKGKGRRQKLNTASTWSVKRTIEAASARRQITEAFLEDVCDPFFLSNELRNPEIPSPIFLSLRYTIGME